MVIRNLLSWYSSLWPKSPVRIPYPHVAQLGEPALRRVAQPVPAAFVNSHETRQQVEALRAVMIRYSAVGLAAPQIGLERRIFLMEFNDRHKQDISDHDYEAKNMSIMPYTVFINPELKVLSHKKIIHNEACESIRGYCANVSRFEKVQIKAFNINGEIFTLSLNGWLARIAQHEMDHLDGKVYTDIMLKESFKCACWKEVNEYKGKIVLPYIP